MFLRVHARKKHGKIRRYFSVVENRRVAHGDVVQRQVLYLGEINDGQEAAWRKTLSVFDEERQRPETLSLFPEDRAIPAEALNAVHVKLDKIELTRPRAHRDCWLCFALWRLLQLHSFSHQK